MKPTRKPIILCFSGHDPSGGAGVQADIEVLTHFNCHPCSVMTCLTVQNSSTVHRLIPLSADDLIEQSSVLFNDMSISVIKIGLTGSAECVKAIAKVLQQHPKVPVIFDPVLAGGDGTALADNDLIASITQRLLPLVTVLTPNTPEARALTGLDEQSSVEALGNALLSLGVNYVLITGGHEKGSTIKNTLFHKQRLIEQTEFKRITGGFHGTGCTLVTAIAAHIALGEPIPSAIQHAQSYTEQAIRNAEQIGQGQLFPKRT
ncbi:MAG: hydroxymethylpyrimidine/phosphomethylpyrimidine kinase [Cycloclasticus sp. symbiont of Poecilosclerida sp. M]|nr:MAG: hydroxymethylpyrimidine/phosphomethylpyrimidine kinase [Cycloclasticus sp. symbiont of Poecilosclerida sp. M]